MKTIDIHTTHNVVIEKGLAGIGLRFVAFLLDFVFLIILYVIITLVFSLANSHLLLGIISTLLLFFFNLSFELAFNGQSLGKKIVGIKIIKLDGKELTFSDLLSRWSLRFIDIYFSFGAIAFLTIGSSPYGQRLGDKIANTTVIKNKDESYFSLREIVKLKNAVDYKSVYNTVTRLTDKDVLLIKNTLKLSTKYPTTNNKIALINLSERVCSLLGIDEVPANKVKFLQTIMRDYIALSR